MTFLDGSFLDTVSDAYESVRHGFDFAFDKAMGNIASMPLLWFGQEIILPTNALLIGTAAPLLDLAAASTPQDQHNFRPAAPISTLMDRCLIVEDDSVAMETPAMPPDELGPFCQEPQGTACQLAGSEPGSPTSPGRK